MKIDNKRNTYRLWLNRMITTIVFTVAILLIIFLPWFDAPSDSKVSKYHLVIVIALAYILLNLHNYLKRPFFVYYSDQGEMITLRYYPLSLFNSRKNSIEIPKRQLVRFEVGRFYFSSQPQLILYQHFRNREAKYPPISLSAVDKQDRKRILQSLEKYSARQDPAGRR